MKGSNAVPRHWARVALLTLLAVALVATACGPQAGGGSTSLNDTVNYSKSDREQYLYDCAKKEGKVVYYTSSSAADRNLKPVFEKKYPGVILENYIATTQLVQRLVEEETAGRHVFDVYGDMHGNIDRDDKFFIAFYTPNRGKLQEPLQTPFMVASNGYFMSMGYNSKIVTANDLPKTWQDLTDPKWSGKIFGSTDTSAPLTVGLLKKTYGLDFVKQLAKNVQVQEGVASRGVADMVIAGQVPLGWNVSSSYYKTDTVNKGAPFGWLPMNPMVGAYQTNSISKYTTHPCAASLFIDWLLANDGGQAVFADLGNSTPFKDGRMPFEIPGAPFSTWKPMYTSDPELYKGYASFKDAAQDWNNIFRDTFVRSK